MIDGQTVPDYYRELEVDPAASVETIRAAYVALAKRYHPDRNHGVDAVAKMQRMNEAFAVLGNDAKRRLYDVQRIKAGFAVPLSGTNAANGSRLRYHPGYDSPPEPPKTSWAGSDEWQQPETPQQHKRWRIGALGYALLALFGIGVAVATLALLGAIPKFSSRAASPTVVAAKVRATGTGTPPPSAVVTEQGTTPHATDVIVGAATHFSHVEHLTEASHKVTSADHAWTFDVDGCTVFDGEYNTPAQWNDAQSYWDGEHLRYRAAGYVVVALVQCDTPTHELEVYDQINDIITQIS